MNYRQNAILNKRLPSYVGITILVFALGITLILSRNTLIFVSKATVGSNPKNIQISNISESGFTISYTTDASAVGTLSYGLDPSTPTIALDDRDQQASSAAEHQVHFITVSNLAPETKYYYVIDSGSQKDNNGGKPFEITTGPHIQDPPPAQPTLSGSVALSDNTVPTEGIMYVTTTNAQQLAVLIKPDGTYQLPLTAMLNSTYTTPATFTSQSILQLHAVTPTQESNVKMLFTQDGIRS